MSPADRSDHVVTRTGRPRNPVLPARDPADFPEDSDPDGSSIPSSQDSARPPLRPARSQRSDARSVRSSVGSGLVAKHALARLESLRNRRRTPRSLPRTSRVPIMARGRASGRLPSGVVEPFPLPGGAGADGAVVPGVGTRCLRRGLHGAHRAVRWGAGGAIVP